MNYFYTNSSRFICSLCWSSEWVGFGLRRKKLLLVTVDASAFLLVGVEVKWIFDIEDWDPRNLACNWDWIDLCCCLFRGVGVCRDRARANRAAGEALWLILGCDKPHRCRQRPNKAAIWSCNSLTCLDQHRYKHSQSVIVTKAKSKTWWSTCQPRSELA